MKNFFKYVLATIIGLLLFSVISVGFFILMAVGIKQAVSQGPQKADVKANSVLKINFDKPITERSKNNPFENVPGFPGQPSSIGLIEIRDALKNAATDGNIKGVYLELGSLSAGYASLEEIRQALLQFKKSKKFVVAYSEMMTEKDYYIASVADEIYLNPAGGMDFNGLSANYTFLKGLFEKLDIKPEIFRVGEFKSAVEPFFRENMSDASKLQTLSFLNSIQNYNWQNISKSRDVSVSELKTIADSLLASEPDDALKLKLITHVGYKDEALASIRKKLNIGEEKEKIEFVALNKYSQGNETENEAGKDNRIAVIIASGEIVSGSSNDNDMISSDNLVEQIKKARLDKKIKAIVLRINSPGGSAMASDVIWREVQLAKKAKPVVASMSDVAASGGYYIAMACDSIVAEPNTITGSIGVFGLMINIEGMLKNKLGITIDGVETNPHASIGSRPLDDFERRYFQKSVNKTYEKFTKKAAEGRKMNWEDLKKVASGRVWSGAEAKEVGLIDTFGGLDDAVKLAARLAKIKNDDYEIKYLPHQKEFLQELFSKMNDDVQEKIFSKQYGSFAPFVKQVRDLDKYNGIQLRMPYILELK